jgi:pyruvate/2-oxoglutarate dehydrogenase complex dihydrolipoamide dehydrogenase (E3) component
VSDDFHERERLANLHPPAWRNPTPADRYHLVIVGGGPAGLAAATTAAALGAKVALIDRNLLGGTCLNVGCVPSKAIIRTSRLYAEMRDAARYGAHDPSDIRVDFGAVMDRMRRLRARVSRPPAARRLADAGIDVFYGDARFNDPTSMTVDGATLRFKKAMIATGSRPDVPSLPGLAEAGYLTNETVFDLTVLPRRLLVIGGGPLGCELAQAFGRFGAKTIIVQDAPLFLPREERDAALLLSDAFARDGLEVRLNTIVVGVRRDGAEIVVDLRSDDYTNTVTVDAILTGVGRLPNVEGMNLEAAGVEHDAEAGIHVDDFLRTSNRHIYAAGDVCLAHRYAHTADATGRMVVHNALFLGRQRLSELTVPWCTFTDPEIAHVGMSVRDALEQEIPVETFTIPLHDVNRAIVDS